LDLVWSLRWIGFGLVFLLDWIWFGGFLGKILLWFQGNGFCMCWFWIDCWIIIGILYWL
jgi:hypothetical protein